MIVVAFFCESMLVTIEDIVGYVGVTGVVVVDTDVGYVIIRVTYGVVVIAMVLV